MLSYSQSHNFLRVAKELKPCYQIFAVRHAIWPGIPNIETLFNANQTEEESEMRISSTKLKNWSLIGPEGRIGAIKDVLCDDNSWTVRYLVVAVGGGLIKRKLLVAPEFITDIGMDNDQDLKTDQRIEDLSSCPRLEWMQPISMQYREALAGHFGSLAYTLGAALLSQRKMKELAGEQATAFVDESKPTSLRSLKEILSYKIINRSGDSSQLHDVFVNDESWSAQYATTNIFHDDRRLQETISMSRIKAVDWGNKVLRLDTRTAPHPFALPQLERAWGMSLTESGVF